MVSPDSSLPSGSIPMSRKCLQVSIAARDTYHFLGSPEGDLALAQAAAYLALAPKSNAIYRAYGAALSSARETPAEPVPLHIRNAPTRLMKDVGYGSGYVYAHDTKAGIAAMDCLPESLSGHRFYRPGKRGFEAELNDRMDRIAAWHERRAAARDDGGRTDGRTGGET